MVNQYCAHSFARNWQLPFLNQWKGENDRRKYFMINLHERMLPPSAGVEPATSWSPVGWCIQLSHQSYSNVHSTESGHKVWMPRLDWVDASWTSLLASEIKLYLNLMWLTSVAFLQMGPKLDVTHFCSIFTNGSCIRKRVLWHMLICLIMYILPQSDLICKSLTTYRNMARGSKGNDHTVWLFRLICSKLAIYNTIISTHLFNLIG